MANQGIKNLTPLAISLVVLTMAISVGGLMLTQFEPASYTENTVTNETHATNLSSTGYKVITVNNVGQGLEQNSETLYDPYNTSNELVEGTDYEVVSYSDGKFNITSYKDSQTSQQDIAIDYTYNSESTGTLIIGDGLSALETFGSFFTVIVVVGIGAVLLLLLKVFRAAGTGKKQAMA